MYVRNAQVLRYRKRKQGTFVVEFGVCTRGVDSPPPKHLDIFKGAPLRLPKPLSDQFPVRVCSYSLCM